MDQNKLAIIIPAYKGIYLQEALQTIGKQTNKNFTVYIGDDDSKDNLKDIIVPFQKEISIVYHKFSSNLGSSSLTQQWDRCVNLSKDENWIWLFSDDDLMPENAVEKFYDTLALGMPHHLYRFNIDMVNFDATSILSASNHPTEESAIDFCFRRLNGETISAACEYIFSRETYQKNGKFIEFPLAWNSDDASWIAFTQEHQIYTIKDARVKWRFSKDNITSNSKDFGSIMIQASLMYSKWLIYFFKDEVNPNNLAKAIRKFIIMQINWIFPSIKLSRLIDLTKNEASALEQPFLRLLFYNYKRLKNKLKLIF